MKTSRHRRSLMFSAISMPVTSAYAGLMDLLNGVSLGKKVAIPELRYYSKMPRPNRSLTLWYFWATWCGPCRETMPLLNDWVDRYPDLGVVAITDEGEDVVRAFSAKVPMEVTIAMDVERKLFNSMHIRGVPYAMLLNNDSVVVWRGQPKELKTEELQALLKAAASDRS